MSEVYKDSSDELIKYLNFKAPNTASYIIDRKSSSFQAVGSNVYTSKTGVRIIRFQINSEDFLDPSSVRVQFDIKNTDGGSKVLYPVSGAHAWFSRLRLLSRGAVCDDISQYNRVHQMLSLLKSSGSSQDDMIESLLNEYNKVGVIVKELSGIQAQQSETVLFKPMCGLLNQEKYIPLKFVPLVLELELDSDEFANIIKPDAGANYNGVYASTAVSSDWQIENCILRCDIIKIDSELQNKYDDYLLKSDGTLSLNYITYHSQILKILGYDFNINLSRALTYLNRVYISFIKSSSATGGAVANPVDFWNKSHNCFYHTLRQYNRIISKDISVPDYYKSEDLVQSAQLQIGNRLIPDYPLQSSSEAFYFLRKSQNLDSVFNNHVHSFNIKGKEYLDHKFIMVFDAEKLNGHQARFTGLNIKNGEQITLKMKMPVQSETATTGYKSNPEDCHILLEAEHVLEIKGSYVRVAD